MIEIYAEFFRKEEKNRFVEELPPEVSLKKTRNSCFIECPDKSAKQLVINVLERHGVSFQET